MKDSNGQDENHFFKELDGIYESINKLHPRDRTAGKCDKCPDVCCKNIETIPITQMELDYIKSRSNNNTYDESLFVRFINKNTEKNACPNFNPNLPGCSIYQIRPLACRLFGLSSESLASITSTECYYYGKESRYCIELEHYRQEFNSLLARYYQRASGHIDKLTPADYLKLAALEKDCGHTEKALELYGKAETAFKKNKRMTFIIKAEKCKLANDRKNAVKYYRKALKLMPSDIKTRYSLAYLEFASGDYDSSLKDCYIVEKHLKSPELYNIMGLCLYAKGDFEQAISSYDTALKKEQTGAVLNNKALALKKLGRYDESLKILTELTKTNPEDIQAVMSLGICFAETGKHGDALQCYEKALKINPEFMELLQCIHQTHLNGPSVKES